MPFMYGQAIRARQQTPGGVLKQRSFFDGSGDGASKEITSGTEMNQWLQLMSSPR